MQDYTVHYMLYEYRIMDVKKSLYFYIKYTTKWIIIFEIFQEI